jgi:hypothetical protein
VHTCLQSGCDKRFKRKADLERHYEQKHTPTYLKKHHFCDYAKCSRRAEPFHRLDHFRDHYRDYHKEDLPRKKGESKSWYDNRSWKPDWWRCPKCLERRYVATDRWDCAPCGSRCDATRRERREDMILYQPGKKPSDSTTRGIDATNSICQNLDDDSGTLSTGRRSSPVSTKASVGHYDTPMSSVVSPESAAFSGTPLESDMMSISDSAEVFVPSKFEGTGKDILKAIRRLALCRILQEYYAMKRGNESHSMHSQPPASSPQSGSSNNRSPDKLSLPKRTSRQGGDDDNTSDGNLVRSGRKKPKLGNTPKRYLACPYFKRNPENHARCGKLALNRIRDVKQHLQRRHYHEHHCPRCFAVFNGARECDNHIRGETVCRPSSGQLDSVSHHQRQVLSKKSNPTIPEEGQWFVIWDVLFPQRKRPNSAYVDPELSDDFRQFQQYSEQHGPRVLGELLDANEIWSMSREERQLRLQGILAQGFGELGGNWIAERSVSVPSRDACNAPSEVGNQACLPGEGMQLQGNELRSEALLTLEDINSPTREVHQRTRDFVVESGTIGHDVSWQLERSHEADLTLPAIDEAGPDLQQIDEDFLSVLLGSNTYGQIFPEDDLAASYNQFVERSQDSSCP